jgi:phosphoacetylglucosamine mutase
LQLPVVITKTGVKHLHHAAQEFDVGIYFEANGHGTVLFSPTYHKVAALAKTTCPALEILPRLINPAVGDAVSDLLLVDALLKHYRWTLKEWNALYTDLPSRQLKISVKDRSVVKCNDNETKCIAPITLQPALEQLMSMTKNSRTFCRASGTENVVRVYAEAPTREQADKVAAMASSLVYEHCGGVGPKSSI